MKAVNCRGNSGIKTLNITKGVGCKVASENIVTKETITKSDYISILNAYPNPTPGKIMISFNSDHVAKYSLKVFDLIGKIQIEESIPVKEGYNKRELNLENVAKGIYMITIQADDKQSKSIRIVVE